MPDTIASYLVLVPLYFPSVVLGLETSLLQNVCVCLYFIKGLHSCCFRVQSCCYIFFSVPLEWADRWKMTTPWVNQSNALHLPGNIVLSGAQTNLNFYFVSGLTHSNPLTRSVKKNSWIYQSSWNDGLGWRLVLLLLYFYQVTLPLSTTTSEISLHLSYSWARDLK